MSESRQSYASLQLGENFAIFHWMGRYDEAETKVAFLTRESLIEFLESDDRDVLICTEN